MEQDKEKEKDIDTLKKQLEQASINININGRAETTKTTEQLEQEKNISDWKSTKQKGSTLKEFSTPKHLINVLINTTEHFGLIMSGEGGLGKTILTLEQIKHKLKPNEWEYNNGYTTPLALYRFLYENRDKKVIILDDVEGVFGNGISLSILKGSLWDSDGQRIVQYNSTSNKTDDLPSQFVMNSKMIILTNSIPKKHDISTRAMMSRTITYELSFDYVQKLEICKKFIGDYNDLTKKQRDKVIRLVEEHTSQATKDFNFRTLKKAIAFIKYDEKKAENLFKATIETDEVKEVYLRAVKEYKTIKEQVSYFKEYSGRGRTTFFAIKKQFRSSVN